MGTAQIARFVGHLAARYACGRDDGVRGRGGTVREVDGAETRDTKLGDIGLIDGQQRTLAMLAGWPQGLQNPLRPVAIWVDLVDTPQGEYRFRLWATTKSQPFGYARINIGGQTLSKLERHKLRLANQAFHPAEGKINAQALWKQPAFMPWDAKFALPLTELIEHKGALLEFVKSRLADYKKALEPKCISIGDTEAAKDVAQHFAKKLSALPAPDDGQFAQHIAHLEKALGKLSSCEFPVIHVRQESFADDDQSSEVNTDPPLAILFKRVGTGGEPLSNADYVYSVIKHHSPQVHGMVEKLLEDEKIRAIYTPTMLVMSAVRLTMLSLKADDSKGQKLTDTAKLDKTAFARMVRNHTGFIEEFKNHIQPDGIFVTSLKQVLENISYTTDFTTGLPKHALCLVQIPLLETLLAWHALRIPSKDTLQGSRLAMVRFVLQGNLCVLDYAKASEVAIKALKESTFATSESFPDQTLLNLLAAADKPLAYPLPSPETLSAVNGLTISPTGSNGLRGWTRFAAEGAHQKYAELYKRWWNRTGRHVHPMLLWLQREYVFATFEKEPALAGMDEETPFDFDHILPSAQWANWTGSGGDNRFIDFPIKDIKDGEFKVLDDSGHWHIGNSIGNIHVLESSENRSWGDASVDDKLDKVGFTTNALIDDQSDWRTAAGDSKKTATGTSNAHWPFNRPWSSVPLRSTRSFMRTWSVGRS
ncbi:DUF1524 domain-containing protein [Rhodoferax antarcticus]|uniref:DUF1524 domain-containing protein n=1 Tax=Rhodoferax antarcticus TaxID=81479 RepID=UPI002225695D|nr:DUF1524 domain-containing protein [Rhodoferax antarcticus]MCW2311331.1 hypothetical protein [Rhodoferax antarcticus]